VVKSVSRITFVLVLLSLVLSTLACQTVARLWEPTSTVTPSPTAVSPAQARHQAIFERVWTLVKENYVYADYNGVDWDAVYAEFAPRVAAAEDDEAFWKLMAEMIERLGDDHSVFVDPQGVAEEDRQAEGNLDYVGIGIYLDPPHDGRDYAVVLMVFPDSPAEQSGLQPHERILEVAGIPVRDNLDGLLGPVGTTVTATVQKPGEAPRVLTFTRARIQTRLPIPHHVIPTPEGEVAYLLIPTLVDETIGQRTRELLASLAQEHELRGLILDLRINGGGTYQVLEELLSTFTAGKMGSFVRRGGTSQVLMIQANPVPGLPPDLPLVILVGPETVSFAEVLSGSLQAVGRAYLIGLPTAGNVEAIYPYDLEDGSRLWLAEESFVPVTGERWEGRGVQPDERVEQAWEDFSSDEEDLALQTALRYLQEVMRQTP